MLKGKLLWLCGEYMLFVQVNIKSELRDISNNYHLELVRDKLTLTVNDQSIALSDDDIDVYRLKKDIKLANVNSHEDYDNIALPIDAFSGIPTLLAGNFTLMSASAT